MYKEGNELGIIYMLIYGCFHCLDSVIYVRVCNLYSPRNKTTSCQHKLSKQI